MQSNKTTKKPDYRARYQRLLKENKELKQVVDSFTKTDQPDYKGLFERANDNVVLLQRLLKAKSDLYDLANRHADCVAIELLNRL